MHRSVFYDRVPIIMMLTFTTTHAQWVKNLDGGAVSAHEERTIPLEHFSDLEKILDGKGGCFRCLLQHRPGSNNDQLRRALEQEPPAGIPRHFLDSDDIVQLVIWAHNRKELLSLPRVEKSFSDKWLKAFLEGKDGGGAEGGLGLLGIAEFVNESLFNADGSLATRATHVGVKAPRIILEHIKKGMTVKNELKSDPGLRIMELLLRFEMAIQRAGTPHGLETVRQICHEPQKSELSGFINDCLESPKFIEYVRDVSAFNMDEYDEDPMERVWSNIPQPEDDAGGQQPTTLNSTSAEKPTGVAPPGPRVRPTRARKALEVRQLLYGTWAVYLGQPPERHDESLYQLAKVLHDMSPDIFDTYLKKDHPCEECRNDLIQLVQDSCTVDAGLRPFFRTKMESGEILIRAEHFYPEVFKLFLRPQYASKEQDKLWLQLVCASLRLEDFPDLEQRLDLVCDSCWLSPERMQWLQAIVAAVIKRSQPQGLENFSEAGFKVEDMGQCMRYGADALAEMLEGKGEDKIRRLLDHRLCHHPPNTWVEHFKSALTVAFFMKYIDREDFEQAYLQFQVKNQSEQGWAFLECLERVKGKFNQPLVTGDDIDLEMGSADAKIRQLKESNSPPPMGALEKVTGLWMEYMQERVQTPMTPHHAQTITMMLFAEWYSQPDRSNACIGQAGTGEGKSLMIAMTAIHFAHNENIKVVVMQNNRNLMERDFDDMKFIIEHFGLSMGKGCDGLTERVQVCYCLASDIESHYLNIPAGDRAELFTDSVLIIDEVDDLIVDKNPTRRFVRTDCTKTLSDSQERNALMTAQGKHEGKDYALVSGMYKMLDEKGRPTNHVSPWLYKLRKDAGQIERIPVDSEFFRICEPHMFKKFQAVVGLTGSIGGAQRTGLSPQDVWGCHIQGATFPRHLQAYIQPTPKTRPCEWGTGTAGPGSKDCGDCDRESARCASLSDC